MVVDRFTAIVYEKRVNELRNQYNADLLALEDALLEVRAEIVARMQRTRGVAPTTGAAGDSATMRAAALWYGIDEAADRELDAEIDRRKDALLFRFKRECSTLRRQLGMT